jgi:hypothetical protein
MISPVLTVISGEYNIFSIVSKLLSDDGTGTGTGTAVAVAIIFIYYLLLLLFIIV